MDSADVFTCKSFPIYMPATLSNRFCAKRHRKAVHGDPCLDCDKGISAAKEDRPMALRKVTCGCGKEFEGGPTATLCPKCRAEKKAAGGGQKKAKSQKPTAVKPKASLEMRSEDSMVLDMLVAIGLVSASKVEQARKFVQGMGR